MSRLASFASLPRPQQLLYLRAIALDATFRGLALIAPFSISRKLALWLSSRHVEGLGPVTPSVRAASRVVPRSNCLSEALTAWVLLTRTGRSPTLRIGVTTGERFEAHAWVECDGVVVLGEHPDREFHPLRGHDLMRG